MKATIWTAAVVLVGGLITQGCGSEPATQTTATAGVGGMGGASGMGGIGGMAGAGGSGGSEVVLTRCVEYTCTITDLNAEECFLPNGVSCTTPEGEQGVCKKRFTGKVDLENMEGDIYESLCHPCMGATEDWNGVDDDCNGIVDDNHFYPNGYACVDPVQCQSGFCVDGYCCDITCTGTCMWCNQYPAGMCRPVPAQQGSDPDTCPSTIGSCDGNGVCVPKP